MARKLEFRGIYSGDHHFHKQMVYGQGVISGESFATIADEESRMYWSVDPETVGMWSGLKDKNRNKIFEGDIFTADSYPFHCEGQENYRGVIIYDESEGYSGWYYNVEPISHRVRGCACGGGLGEIDLSGLEVIGNIHENPELLERPHQDESGQPPEVG